MLACPVLSTCETLTTSPLLEKLLLAIDSGILDAPGRVGSKTRERKEEVGHPRRRGRASER